jgi:hypothetical protein
MIYALVVIMMGSLRGLADAGSFEVNGDFQAGASEGTTGQRSFTIKSEDLSDVYDYTAAELDSSFTPDDAVATDGKVKFTQKKKSDVAATGGQTGEQGMKYKHFVPRDVTTSTVYLPNTANTFVHDSDGPILLEGWIRKTFVADIKKELKQTQNAIRVLGALLGLDMKTLREVLTFDRETMAFVESIKAGAIPVYVPGDLFVAKTAEINTDADVDKPSFCDAWSGTGQAGTKGTTDWVLQDIMGYGTSGSSSGVNIKTAAFDVDFVDGDDARRWDDITAFASDKGKRDTECTNDASCTAFSYAAADAVDTKIKDKYTKTGFENTEFNGAELDYTNVFGAATAGTALEKKARYSSEVIEAIEAEVDACKVVL